MRWLSMRQAMENGRNFAKTGGKMNFTEFLICFTPVWVLGIAVVLGLFD